MTPGKPVHRQMVAKRHPIKSGNSVGGSSQKNNMHTIDTSFPGQSNRDYVGLVNTEKR